MIPAEAAGLPVAAVLDEVVAALQATGSAIVVAPPGAGKTTLVPLALLDAVDGRIVMLEPRRLATRAAAQRMATLLGEPVGGTVGYQTRDERRIGRQTRIEVVTEGVLTRRLQHDPTLHGVSAVLFDEVHERNLPTDLGLAFLLDARATVRPDLWVAAMSATPDVAALGRILPDATVVRAEGRTFPVEIFWVPRRRDDRLEQVVTATVVRALREQPGDVLVFLPGIGEIRRLEATLAPVVGPDVDVWPLAGALSLAEHDRALAPSPPGRRRVVVSTDIAESSLTVEGVRVVVDAGLARVPRFDARTGMTRLTTVPTSRASADQRAGRAGRTEPGACYRLWGKLEHGSRRAHLEPEITQVDLAGTALEVAAWGTPADRLGWMDAPPARTLRAAQELLTRLGAITDGRITDIGRRMSEVPAHPRLARMVVDAVDRGEEATACVVATLLDDRDVFRGPPDRLPADLALRVAVVAGRHGHDSADRRDVQRARDRAADLARRVGSALDLDAVMPERTGALLAVGFPDRLAVARSQRGQFQLRGGQGAFVAPDDPLAGESFVIAADLDGNRSGARLRLGAAVDATDVLRVFADEVEARASLEFDRERGDLVMRDELRLGSIVLDQRIGPPAPGPDVVEHLLRYAHETRWRTMANHERAAGTRARIAFARRVQPDRWPDWSDAVLAATAEDWLAPFLQSATGRRDLDAVDLDLALRSQLTWDDQQRLDQIAPPTWRTPRGRDVPIDYERAQPTVSVRAQQLFGVSHHPTVGNGTVPLTVEVLSPADRPIQITADLPGFWAGSWSEVRKDMAGRYPKHEWPADPRTV